MQNTLLAHYESPVLTQLFSERDGITVLDIGCNDGTKTVERFSSDAVSKVIGLEYNTALAVKAQSIYGNEKFAFYSLDVEADGFAKKLKALMNEKGIDGFDVIYLSFVLMHLSDTKKLLCVLRSFLKENGKLLILEANDKASTLNNDRNGLLHSFLEILRADKYSGNRNVGNNICELLRDSGYDNIDLWFDSISAGVGEEEKKEAIFTTFFSYLPDDITLLLDEDPENDEYKFWYTWLEQNYNELKTLVLSEESIISMGMKILTCTVCKER